jgi:hypothetical protein
MVELNGGGYFRNDAIAEAPVSGLVADRLAGGKSISNAQPAFDYRGQPPSQLNERKFWLLAADGDFGSDSP